MKINTKVSWLVRGYTDRGQGTVIMDEDNDGFVVVAVDHFFGEHNLGYHPLIWCSTSWLEVESEPAPEADSAPQQQVQKQEHIKVVPQVEAPQQTKEGAETTTSA
jgi:hypothetical protein